MGAGDPYVNGYVNPYVNGYVNPTSFPTRWGCVPLASVAEGVCTAQCPRGGPVGRKNRGRLAPLGGVLRPRRKERFARLTHEARPRSWRTFGRRRLRRQAQPDLVATHGGTTGLPASASGAPVGAAILLDATGGDREQRRLRESDKLQRLLGRHALGRVHSKVPKGHQSGD